MKCPSLSTVLALSLLGSAGRAGAQPAPEFRVRPIGLPLGHGQHAFDGCELMPCPGIADSVHTDWWLVGLTAQASLAWGTLVAEGDSRTDILVERSLTLQSGVMGRYLSRGFGAQAQVVLAWSHLEGEPEDVRLFRAFPEAEGWGSEGLEVHLAAMWSVVEGAEPVYLGVSPVLVVPLDHAPDYRTDAGFGGGARAHGTWVVGGRLEFSASLGVLRRSPLESDFGSFVVPEVALPWGLALGWHGAGADRSVSVTPVRVEIGGVIPTDNVGDSGEWLLTFQLSTTLDWYEPREESPDPDRPRPEDLDPGETRNHQGPTHWDLAAGAWGGAGVAGPGEGVGSGEPELRVGGHVLIGPRTPKPEMIAGPPDEPPHPPPKYQIEPLPVAPGSVP